MPLNQPQSHPAASTASRILPEPMRTALFALLQAGALAGAAEPPAQEPDALTRARALAAQMGDNRYQNRVDATAALHRFLLQLPWQHQLDDELRTHPDLEIRLRYLHMRPNIYMRSLDTTRPVNLDVRNTPAARVLEMLHQSTGNRFHLGEAFQNQSIDLVLKDSNYWDALQHICDKTGSRFTSDQRSRRGEGLLIEQGKSDEHAVATSTWLRGAITGVNRLHLTPENSNVAEKQDNAYLALNLQCESSAPVIAFFRDTELVAGRTDDGHEIQHRLRPAHTVDYPHGTSLDTQKFDIRGITPRSKRIEGLHLRVDCLLAGDYQELRLPVAAKDAVCGQGISARVKTLHDAKGSWDLTCQIDRPTPYHLRELVRREIRFRALDGEGQEIPIGSFGDSACDGDFLFTLNLSRKPETVIIEYPRVREMIRKDLLYKGFDIRDTDHTDGVRE